MATPRKAKRMMLAKEGEAQRTNAKGAPKGSYPTDTKGRASSAKARASHAEKVGRISEKTEKAIDRRANKDLYGKPKAPKGRKQS